MTKKRMVLLSALTAALACMVFARRKKESGRYLIEDYGIGYSWADCCSLL